MWMGRRRRRKRKRDPHPHGWRMGAVLGFYPGGRARSGATTAAPASSPRVSPATDLAVEHGTIEENLFLFVIVFIWEITF